MGWGTSFKHEVFIRNKVFNNKAEIEDEIDEEFENISIWKQELGMLAALSLKEYPLEEGHDLLYSIRDRVNGIVEGIIDSSMNIRDCRLLLEYLEDNPKVDTKTLSE